MDNLPFFLMTRANSEHFYRDVFLLFLAIPLFKYLFSDMNSIFNNIKNAIFSQYKNKVEFVGWENLYSGMYHYDYPYPMTAVCHKLVEKQICSNLRYFNPSRNGNMYGENIQSYAKDKNISYIINYGKNIKIEKDLYLDFNYYTIDTGKESKSDGNWKVNIVIKSKHKSIQEINDFINQCMKEYDEYLEEKSKNKIYHFIYQGQDRSGNKKLQFSTSILSDFSIPDRTNYESFSNLYSEHKNMLIRDLKRLKDIEYFKKTGNKRKKGYLFYGPPGCGKTSSVIAMALEDKRHIIEISMSRIKTNEELEQLFNLTEIQGIKFQKSQIILLFDEIDTGTKVLKKRDGEEDNNSENKMDKKDEIILKLMSKDEDDYQQIKRDDQVHLGCVLSRFDGVGSYNGLVIIATTNCKEKLSPALYRNGRLNPVFFDFINKEQIKHMIQDYYLITLDKDEIDKLPDNSNKLSHSSMRKFLEDYEDNHRGLIEFLASQKN